MSNKEYKLILVDLRLFDGTNVTTDGALSDEMKTYYSNYLIDNAEPELVHDQFAQKHSIPKNGGKEIEFRKFSPLPKALTPLTEGVTPSGQKLSVSVVTATVSQYGGYVELSDILLLTAIDNNLVMATQLLGGQAGRSMDTVTREVLSGGTNVQYGEDKKTAREALVGGAEAGNDYLTVDAIKRAVVKLKRMNAPRINGSYAAIIHPEVSYDLRNDPQWIDPHRYKDTTELYEGEIGMIEGVRFVETTEAKKWINAALNGATAKARDVYSTLVLGNNAFGTTELTGGGLSHIVKPLGSGGATDPLDQRATAGWKATKTAIRLVEEYMVRIETTGTFNTHEAS